MRQIAADARALASKVRDGRSPAGALRRHLLGVEPGDVRVTSFGAIVNSPRPGSSRSGAITDKPVVKDGEVVPAK